MTKLRLVCAMCTCIVSVASAQDAVREPNESSPAAETEHVIVTGSYIPTQTAAEVGANPVQTIDRSTIERAGERNTEELLRNLPIANANGVPTSGQPGTIYGQGASSISLRGFDPGATLVLLNGHRVVNHPSGSSGGSQFFIDLNTIPKAAIENVEILKDGASSTYGADAVAGVVNIKLRQDYRGAEVNVEYGNTTDRDSSERSASLVFGLGDDKTSFTGVLNYYSREAIFNHDRAYDRETPISRTSTNASPYNLEVSRAAAEAAAGRPVTEVDPALDTFFAHAPFFSNGTAPASQYSFTEGPEVTFPVNQFQGELPETQRYGAYLSVEHKIFGDQMVAYADVFFQRDQVRNTNPPIPTSSFQNPGNVTIAIPPHAPGATLGGPTPTETDVPEGAYNPFNPFQQIISGGSQARLFESGIRSYDNDTDAFFTTVGVRGDKLFNGTWGYDGTFRYSQSEATIDFNNFISSTRFNRILNAADPIFDPQSPQFIGTTIPFNPFGDYRVPNANNQRLIGFARARPREVDTGKLAVFDLNIYTTDLFDLPAGGVGFAFGAQHQDESLAGVVGPEFEAGDIRPLQIISVFGNRQSYAGYAEASIPVFGSKFSVPGFHALDLSAAVRYESFSTGSNVMVPKFGLRWHPFDDSLTLRATWGEGYRLPTLAELNIQSGSGSASLFDPVKNVFVNDVPQRFLPNPHLQPEDSRSFTTGFVYSPKFARGLTLRVDVFNIETTGWVNPLPDPTQQIIRIESGNAFPGESVERDAQGNLLSFTSVAFENTGTKKARGVDLGLNYERETAFGTFRTDTQVTYLDSFQFSPFRGQPEAELRSSPVDQFSDDAYLKWKGISRWEWLWRGFDSALTVRYDDGFHEFVAPDYANEHWVKQRWLFDLQASYEFGSTAGNTWAERFHHGWPKWRYLLDRTKLTVGITNLFDTDPPRSNDNFPRFLYDPTGRFIYASLEKKF